jgi:hypothetical protein
MTTLHLSGRQSLAPTTSTGSRKVEKGVVGSFVYGASVWNIKVNDRTKQENLIITAFGEPVITVDNIKIAQFIYLLLNNQEIRDVIDTITSKAVLILGRFSEDRKGVWTAVPDFLSKCSTLVKLNPVWLLTTG